jgi:hypothetical protein
MENSKMFINDYTIRLSVLPDGWPWKWCILGRSYAMNDEFIWPEWEQLYHDNFKKDGIELWPVSPYAPKRIRQVCERYAEYFRREFNYDFMQYRHYDDGHIKDRIFFFVDAISRHALGAICFRWMEQDGLPHGYWLAWVWLHPYARACGILSAWWPTFRELYGDFLCATPISPAMSAFLAKRNECWRCGVMCKCEPTATASAVTDK